MSEQIGRALEGFISTSPRFPNARCKDIADPDIFFPDSKEELFDSLPVLRRICGACEHKVECAEYAIDEEIDYGIWGGTTGNYRRTLWRKRGRFSNVQKKGRAAHNLHQQGWSVKMIANRYGVSTDLIYQWMRRYENAKVKMETVDFDAEEQE